MCNSNFQGAVCQIPKSLTTINPLCMNSQCLNGGTCMVDYGTNVNVYCKCVNSFFTGARCQVQVNPNVPVTPPPSCVNLQCGAFGTCTLNVNGNVFCLCNPGYFGTQCTTATGTTTKNPVCVNNPCNNGNIKIILYCLFIIKM